MRNSLITVLERTNRQKTLDFLIEQGSSDVTSIYKYLNVSQSVGSQILKDLKNAKLVSSTRQSKHIYYSAIPANIILFNELLQKIKDEQTKYLEL